MTIDDAIKILRLHSHGNSRPIDPDLDNAIDLGIEALKFYKNLGHTPGLMIALTLPGETAE